MSRGHGKVQRAILAALEPAGTRKTISQLVAQLFPDAKLIKVAPLMYVNCGIEHQNARNTINRALLKLRKEGLVECGQRADAYGDIHRNARLYVWLPNPRQNRSKIL
jgi:hypothetical protein